MTRGRRGSVQRAVARDEGAACGAVIGLMCRYEYGASRSGRLARVFAQLDRPMSHDPDVALGQRRARRAVILVGRSLVYRRQVLASAPATS
jgi:hypothetical protein